MEEQYLKKSLSPLSPSRIHLALHLLNLLQLHIRCDENDDHTAVLYCTVCTTHLCESCSDSTHSTRTLAKHRRVPLSEKPREKSRCQLHPSHVAEFTCLDEECRANPTLMCYLCKDYGRHKNHKHALVETEADNIRTSVRNTASHMRNLMEEMGETLHRLGKFIIKLVYQLCCLFSLHRINYLYRTSCCPYRRYHQ